MFKFKLEPVLRVKKIMEDIKKREFGETLRAFLSAKKRLEELREERHNILKILENETIDPYRLRRALEYAQFLKGELERLEKEVEKKRRELERKRRELMDAMKERKIMERLKEKKLEEYRREEFIKEVKLLDEIGSYKYTR